MDERVADRRARGPRIEILLDGEPLEAFEGETVAAALLAAGVRSLGTTPRAGAARGVWCGIGLCFACEVTVDGRSRVRACRESVRAGMRVETRTGTGERSLGP
jgi:predicted molibdopterin-dependent oxidoreductase YjgC